MFTIMLFMSIGSALAGAKYAEQPRGLLDKNICEYIEKTGPEGITCSKK